MSLYTQVTQLSRLVQRCTIGPSVQYLQVRHRQRANFKKSWTRKIKNEDPDLAWADQIFEMQNSGGLKEEKPASEPHMLHVVCRLKPLKGQTKQLKKIMERFGLDGPANKFVVLKNEPSVNHKLRLVKHLIDIMPLKLPYGLPEHESDFEHTFINSQGELIIRKRLEPIEPVLLEENAEKDKWKLEHETINKQLKKKKDKFAINTEYFKPKHVYKRNEDGKEYRYTHNLRD